MDPLGLTPAERQIADALADGRTVQQIAAASRRVVPTSTQFDGDWNLVLTLTTDLNNSGNPESVCLLYNGAQFSVTVEHGAFAIAWREHPDAPRIALYALISPYGQFESSFGIDEGVWYPLGSLNGYAEHDGTGGGQWIHLSGCLGAWTMQRVDG